MDYSSGNLFGLCCVDGFGLRNVHGSEQGSFWSCEALLF